MSAAKVREALRALWAYAPFDPPAQGSLEDDLAALASLEAELAEAREALAEIEAWCWHKPEHDETPAVGLDGTCPASRARAFLSRHSPAEGA